MITLQGIGRHEWERIIRRVQLTPSTMLVALTMASYANKDGTRIYPGVQRLINVTGMSKRTVLRGLTELRDAGLVECVLDGSRTGTRGVASVYRLTIPDDLLGRLTMLTPDESVPDQVPSEHPAQVPGQHPGSGGPGATDDTDQGAEVTDQGALVTQPGATSSPPPVHDHPSTNPDDKGVDRLGDQLTSEVGHEVDAELASATAVLATLKPQRQSELMDEASRQGATDFRDVVRLAARLHRPDRVA